MMRRSFLINNQNNYNYNVICDSESSDESKGKLFDEYVDEEVKVDPKTTINPEVVCAMKKLQASYNDDANKLLRKQLKKVPAKD